mgnify:CR=1 FL=1
MDALTVPLARPKVVLNVAICAGFLLIGLWAFSREDYLIALASAYFVLPLAFHISRLLSGRSEALVIDRAGLADYTPNLGVGLIRWSEVEDIELRKIGITSFLNVRVRNGSALLARLSSLKRFNAWLNSLFGYSPILINLSSTYADPQKLIEKIREARVAL